MRPTARSELKREEDDRRYNQTRREYSRMESRLAKTLRDDAMSWILVWDRALLDLDNASSRIMVTNCTRSGGGSLSVCETTASPDSSDSSNTLAMGGLSAKILRRRSRTSRTTSSSEVTLCSRPISWDRMVLLMVFSPYTNSKPSLASHPAAEGMLASAMRKVRMCDAYSSCLRARRRGRSPNSCSLSGI